MIDVLVVDDQQLIRDAVAELVSQEPDMRLLGTAGSGIEAVRKTKQLSPDVVVMDVRMPVMDGIEATRLITQDPTLRDVRVLILTTFEDDADYVVRGVRSGAVGFLGKGAAPGAIAGAVRAVHRGDGLISPRATKNFLDRYVGSAQPTETHPDLQVLTSRELDILRLVAAGHTNQAIAEQLSISVITVKTHVNRTMVKVGRHDRAQLVVLAFETGLVAPRYR
jgi:DNA-binding NarL/FixJ family response regulator